MASIPTEFKGVTVVTRANVYFDGKVISHTLLFPDGSKKTLGVISPGKFRFSTDKAESMEIIAGHCLVQHDQQDEVNIYREGQSFEVPAQSGFDIEVDSGLCQYICSFMG
jgi:uncharacterized protein YaiE (UPF0345 family)